MVSCGNYELQVLLLELLFRLCSNKQIQYYAHTFFPTSSDLADTFQSINRKEFDSGSRTFLNKLNFQFDRIAVFSIEAQYVKLGESFVRTTVCMESCTKVHAFSKFSLCTACHSQRRDLYNKCELVNSVTIKVAFCQWWSRKFDTTLAFDKPEVKLFRIST